MRNRKGTEKETVSRDGNVDCKEVQTRNEERNKLSVKKRRMRKKNGTEKETGSRDTNVDRKEVATLNEEKAGDSP